MLSKQEERDIERETAVRGLREQYEQAQQEVVRAMCEREDREMMKGHTPDVIGPTRASTFPDDAKGRKQRPVASGVLDYFPDALVAIAQVSFAGNEQHNPGQPLHWARNKSSDEADALMRHFLQRGEVDSDGIRHSAKMAWRALALLQKEIEKAAGLDGIVVHAKPERRGNSPDDRYMD